ncbi:phenoloxidase-activating factor 2-like [Drosophila hydei]|uniref:Phenoloxidase-activating factor 2 n=1 Tax=Drosophila hydei TaxID=7224 RepID=A0A6J2STW9_DROHY|nr:phenoloxidase-activating factor 2-like [Drosophila hydei]
MFQIHPREIYGNFRCSSRCDALQRTIATEQHVSGLCGVSNPKGIRLTVVNTQHSESQFGEFPWMVAILSHSCIDTSHTCGHTLVGGGSLLAPDVVLTAAHIFTTFKNDNVVARAGEWDSQNTFELLKHQDREVKEINIHPDFNSANGFYDIALLILSSPFDLDEHIGTICLPSPQAHLDLNKCIVTGWGRLKLDDLKSPNIMKKIELPFVNRTKCQEQLRDNTHLGQYFELHESFVCAGGEKDKDACFGDGGSPLVCPIANYNDRYQLVGLVSWGLHCGAENVPGVYANVRMMVPWIRHEIRLLSE